MHATLLWRAWNALALVLVLVLAGTLARAEPQVALVYGGRLVVSNDGSSSARADAKLRCTAMGGILFADHSQVVVSQFAQEMSKAVTNGFCAAKASGWTFDCYGTHTAGWADTSPGCTVNPRESLVNVPNAIPLSSLCPYRWSEGWFSRYSDDGAVGVTFHNHAWADLNSDVVTKLKDNLNSYDLFINDASADNIYKSGPVNGYTDGVIWNASLQCNEGAEVCISPHGYQYIALGARSITRPGLDAYGVRVDVPGEISSMNMPFVSDHYVLTCQWQGVEASFYDGIQQPSEYPFVQGWDNLTWAQSHWWVIFLIIAVLVLAALVAFIIWWWCKHRGQKEQEDTDDENREYLLYCTGTTLSAVEELIPLGPAPKLDTESANDATPPVTNTMSGEAASTSAPDPSTTELSAVALRAAPLTKRKPPPQPSTPAHPHVVRGTVSDDAAAPSFDDTLSPSTNASELSSGAMSSYAEVIRDCADELPWHNPLSR